MTGSKLQTLIAQRARLDEARRAQDNAIRVELKKQLTRKKVLLGAYLLERMEQDSALRAQTLRALDGWLRRDQDRVLFDFEPSSPSEPDAGASVRPAGEGGGVNSVTRGGGAPKAAAPAGSAAGAAQKQATSAAARAARKSSAEERPAALPRASAARPAAPSKEAPGAAPARAATPPATRSAPRS